MKLLILGATGQIGQHVVDAALEAQHSLVLYVRSPKKLPADLKLNSNVSIVEGDLTNKEALSEAVKGVHAVISAIGPSFFGHPAGNPLTAAYTLLLELMKDHDVKRVILLGTASNKDENDKSSIIFDTTVLGAYLFGHSAYSDVVAFGKEIRAASPEVLWTLARVPVLTNTEAAYHAGYIGDGETKPYLSRKAWALFVVGEVTSNLWIKKAPMISSSSKPLHG
ncbi:NAD-P-binding protein [Sistotremastrum niveocremeum HHB9708]|uniref:NAD-P-binding protein n=1 Tax=Sistotremastrum niveocremeum HHB9708 TaxID=1314777 RepID=A0A165AJ65_9AGAM|nr:NAD-P-binding protein [Sistotremastrum niveocremeum HHB9708]